MHVLQREIFFAHGTIAGWARSRMQRKYKSGIRMNKGRCTKGTGARINCGKETKPREHL